MSNIKQFIKENNLSFEEGSRNTTVTILIGYAQHLGLEQDALESELSSQIEASGFIQDEVDRLWAYCAAKNYKHYWTTPIAQKQYKF